MRRPTRPVRSGSWHWWPCWGVICLGIASTVISRDAGAEDLKAQRVDRSPVDLVLAKDESWLVTVNETSNSLSLVDVKQRAVLDELACGEHPAKVTLAPDGRRLLVSCAYRGEILLVEVEKQRLVRRGSLTIGNEPVGLAIVPSGERAYVGLQATGEVAEVDLVGLKVLRRIAVGAWPRYLAVSPDGTRLAVGCSGESKVVVVDTARGEVLYDERLVGGINLGHMECSSDGRYVYFPWMVYRSNPITPGNIRLGWVLASRIGRVRLDGPADREAISLDVPGKAVADPHGLALSGDGRRLVVAASGTHELLVYRRPDLPFIGAGGPGDLIDRRLLSDGDLFFRIPLGGRPMGVAMSADQRTAFVANYSKNSVQEVDIQARAVVREIALGEAPPATLARRGMEIFYDGQRSLDQWYSCHTCHYNGGVSSKAMDTFNDGSAMTMKTVPPLYNLRHTGPWTWHGWQTDLRDAMSKSFTTTMQGQPINDEDSAAVLAYFDSLRAAPNSFRRPDGGLTEAAQRGEQLFRSSKAACATCHSGDYFTDGKVHDVGLGAKEDRYRGFNTPSLLNVYRKVRFLHDGRAKTLDDVLTGDHAPEKVAGEGPLTAEERADLIAYLKSL